MIEYYPSAIQAPWKYRDPTGQTNYFAGINQPEAVVLHIQAGYAHTGIEWAAAGHYGASWHYTVSYAGEVFQHLKHSDGGFHAGIQSPPAPKPRWSLYKGPSRNINSYTIGIEHEGFPGDPMPTAQANASRELCRWLAENLGFPYDREHFPPHADIDLVNRSNDFNLPALREAHYKFMFEEEEMTPEQINALIDARIAEKQNSGALASTTDVLSCVAQIAGSEPLTYTDKARVEAARKALAAL